ncbi:MAG: hypothetical protein IJP17_05040, partial [Clostridia bacterium]|nr:hypothetical protein [Clostridia bacterium]
MTNIYGKTHKPSAELQQGVKYILTNCDTGRNISVEGNKLFAFENGGFVIGEYTCKLIPLC